MTRQYSKRSKAARRKRREKRRRAALRARLAGQPPEAERAPKKGAR